MCTSAREYVSRMHKRESNSVEKSLGLKDWQNVKDISAKEMSRWQISTQKDVQHYRILEKFKQKAWAYYFRLFNLKKKNYHSSKSVEQLEPTYSTGGNENGTITLQRIQWFLTNSTHSIHYSTTPLLFVFGICSKSEMFKTIFFKCSHKTLYLSGQRDGPSIKSAY